MCRAKNVHRLNWCFENMSAADEKRANERLSEQKQRVHEKPFQPERPFVHTAHCGTTVCIESTRNVRWSHRGKHVATHHHHLCQCVSPTDSNHKVHTVKSTKVYTLDFVRRHDWSGHLWSGPKIIKTITKSNTIASNNIERDLVKCGRTRSMSVCLVRMAYWRICWLYIVTLSVSCGVRAPTFKINYFEKIDPMTTETRWQQRVNVIWWFFFLFPGNYACVIDHENIPIF